ncbi:MAG: hypothetical protein ABSA79_00350 [Candidatus Bathyarchaeia archaeon]
MFTCEYCGQEYRFVHTCYEQQPQKVKDRYEKPFKQATEKKLNMVIVDGLLSQADNYVRSSQKYGFSLKDTITTNGAFGIESAKFVFELTPKTEGTIRYCQYCGTVRDISKTPLCPKCGA